MIMAYFMLKSYISVMTAASLFDSTECVSQHNILINSPLTKQKKWLNLFKFLLGFSKHKVLHYGHQVLFVIP